MAVDQNVFPTDPSIGEARFHPPGDQSSSNMSLVGAQATVTATAGQAGERYVCTGFSFSLASNQILTMSTVGCFVIDGATGGTTYLWREVMHISSLGATPIRMNGLNLVGSSGTALTIEFSGTVSNANQSVSMSYHKIGAKNT